MYSAYVCTKAIWWEASRRPLCFIYYIFSQTTEQKRGSTTLLLRRVLLLLGHRRLHLLPFWHAFALLSEEAVVTLKNKMQRRRRESGRCYSSHSSAVTPLICLGKFVIFSKNSFLGQNSICTHIFFFSFLVQGWKEWRKKCKTKNGGKIAGN